MHFIALPSCNVRKIEGILLFIQSFFVVAAVGTLAAAAVGAGLFCRK